MNELSISEVPANDFEHQADIGIVGAGAAGLIAALAAAESGASVVIFERDASPVGSTSLSAGLIPASGTRWQAEQDIGDNPNQFADDIVAKSHCETDRALATSLASASANVVHWLSDCCGVPLSLVDGFTYPGHQVRRMHGTPSRTGTELMASLLNACGNAGIDIVTNARVYELCFDSESASGLGYQQRDESLPMAYFGSSRIILACNGYGGNRELIAQHIPQIQQALYFGHAGNTGDAVVWATQMNAGLNHMSAYQGHGSVAKPHGILITWAVMMEGGIQVNLDGHRFSNEHAGYSEQAVHVIDQPGRVAWNIFDNRILKIAEQFDDFRQADKLGALITAPDVATLASRTGLPVEPLQQTLVDCNTVAAQANPDGFGRYFAVDKLLEPPYYAVRVEAALFHTQGGLTTDHNARVLDRNGKIITGVYAVGGAAQGVSGDTVDGYLSGNGLLTAVTLGYTAGKHAAGD